jgi:tetratricopeptide (TPR) repeat protein
VRVGDGGDADKHLLRRLHERHGPVADVGDGRYADPMLAIVVAVVAGLVTGGLLGVIFSSAVAGVLPALVVMPLVYVLLVLRVNKMVQAAMGGVMAAAQKGDVDGAVAMLTAIQLRFGRWAPFLSSQIDGQIGTIHFMKKDFDKARPFLERAFVRSWDAKLMQAILLSGALDAKKQKKKEMTLAPVDELLEKAIRFNDKQGLLWSTWAWLHWKNGDAKKAVSILSRGKEKLGESDAHLSANLLALQNDKEMKMKGYGQQWYAMHLEEHPAVYEQRRMQNVRFARR